MDRAERIGLGVALAAHAALFVALSFGLLTRPDETPPRDAVSITLTDEIGVESSSPSLAEAAPAPLAPEMGPPEVVPPEPESSPAPRVETAPPPPATRPTPQRREPPPRTRRETRSEPAERPRRPAQRQRGSRLAGITEGLGQNPSESASRSSSAATITGAERSSYMALIGQQIRPCVNRQSTPGPGAEQINTSLSIRFDRDGSLSARPSVQRQTGVNDDNRRYAERVRDLAIASVMGCAPIDGLPPDLYRAANGQGWNTVTVNIRIDPSQ